MAMAEVFYSPSQDGSELKGVRRRRVVDDAVLSLSYTRVRIEGTKFQRQITTLERRSTLGMPGSELKEGRSWQLQPRHCGEFHPGLRQGLN
jgi:hypothetical protein